MKKSYGQYFTPSYVARFMVSMADISKDAQILEPSCGDGAFLDVLHQQGFDNVTAYEIDKSLLHRHGVIYESFISAETDKKFDLVIGNPPYIRWKNLDNDLKSELQSNELWLKYCNSLCDYLYIFIIKSIHLLKDGGQLIFICPEYWLNTSHSQKMRNFMLSYGYMDTIISFNESVVFGGVASSSIIFKYIKSQKNDKTIKVTKLLKSKKIDEKFLQDIAQKNLLDDVDYFDMDQFSPNSIWSLKSKNITTKLLNLQYACIKKENRQDLLEKSQNIKLSDICMIGNGMVSGLDKAFQYHSNEFSDCEKNDLIKVIKAKNLKQFFANGEQSYILIDNDIKEDEFQINYPNFYQHLQLYKSDLLKRYQYNKDIPYWQWVFLRNYKLFSQNERKIFVPCKERISHKNYFRFALVGSEFYPTQDVTAIFKKIEVQESLEYITAYLNQPIIFDWLRFNGVVKGNIVEFSEKPLSNIPFRCINLDDEYEVMLHDDITKITANIVLNKDLSLLKMVQKKFNQLLRI